MDYDYVKKIVGDAVRDTLKAELTEILESSIERSKSTSHPLPERTHLTAKEVIAEYNISDRTPGELVASRPQTRPCRQQEIL